MGPRCTHLSGTLQLFVKRGELMSTFDHCAVCRRCRGEKMKMKLLHVAQRAGHLLQTLSSEVRTGGLMKKLAIEGLQLLLNGAEGLFDRCLFLQNNTLLFIFLS